MLPRLPAAGGSTYTGKARKFTIEIDPAALPPEVEAAAVPYTLRAGQCALHDPLMPHRSAAGHGAHLPFRHPSLCRVWRNTN